MVVYAPTTQLELSVRKRRAYEEFCRVVNWGRRNPVKFAYHFLGVRLMDYQQYAFMESWTKPFCVWLMCRGAGKTALAAPYLMTKLMLVPNYDVYIGATKQEQAIESFTKLEKIALNQIPSFEELTDVFRYELEHKQGASPFGHDPAGYRLKLFNGSSVKTLSGNVKGVRGKRGSMWYDEASFITKEFIDVCDQFTSVDASFGLGSDYTRIKPRQMPMQLLYTSSAGSIDSVFYERFRTYAKRMIAGDPNYFVCNFEAFSLLDHSSVDGKPITSHLNREKIERDMRDDPEMADREHFNHFKRGAGKLAVISDDCLNRNSHSRLPVFSNDTGRRKFVFCYDPARSYDNSILGIFELKDDPKIGYYFEVANVISMVNIEQEKKTPLNYVDQLEIIKNTMVAYNGAAPEWENIEFYIDAGSGGAPRSGILDQLLFPWTDEKGEEHRGIIDPDDPEYEPDFKKHPGNAKIVHLLNPAKYKAAMFGALIEVADLDLIRFTEYDGYRDYITIPGKDENGRDAYIEHVLTPQERQALLQINLMKTEISYMCRTQTPNSHAVTYSLTKEMQRRMHDDRAYVLAMAGFALWQIRNKDLRNRRLKQEKTVLFPCRKPVLPELGRRF